MGETPSKRRRKGRLAFEPGVDPMLVQPYEPGTWAYENYLEDWLDGWKEAEKQHEMESQHHLCSKCNGDIDDNPNNPNRCQCTVSPEEFRNLKERVKVLEKTLKDHCDTIISHVH